MKGQINIFDKIIVDNFAGGGGASTGIEMATGRIVDIAVNHDHDAILMHQTNHPYTTHYQASVWDIDPREVCHGRKVGLAWFSPDCKHFSKAKGAALVDRNIRGLAWIVLRWAGTVRPDVIILENVEEFQTWGPVRRGKPIKSKSGQTFQKWKRQLSELGYDIEHRELVAADYGAPTTRKRFFLVARCDGKHIRWPEATHAPADSEAVKQGRKKPWRAAAEIIDWSLPCYSIFDSKESIKTEYGVNAVRPLAENTLRRVIRGVDKFTIKSGKPFIVECNHAGAGHIKSTEEPVGTVTAKYTGGLCEPVLSPLTISNTGFSAGADAGNPIHTVRTGGGGQMLVAPNLIQYHTEQTENCRANGVAEPIMTVDSSNRYGLTTAQLVQYFGGENVPPLDVTKPLRTVTTHDREAVVAVHIDKAYAGGYTGAGSKASDPLDTITCTDHNRLAASHIVKFKGADLGQHLDSPLQTITTSAGNFAECRITICKADRRDLGYWPQIRELLNRYCGYSLRDDEIILLWLGGTPCYIRDIGLRMLTPPESYAAMGFPLDYIIDHDYTGKEYGKSKQTAKCGNAVPPPLAAAMVRANLPEWCDRPVQTMGELMERVTA